MEGEDLVPKSSMTSQNDTSEGDGADEKDDR
jgi:hypothetical protein